MPMLRALIALLPLAACSTYIEDRTSEEFMPVYDEAANFLPPPVTGGIYNSATSGLFASDLRAARVGDVLTVQFTERFAATKSQSANASKASSYEIDLPDLGLGLDGGRLANSTDQSFFGRGGAAQSNSLTGRLTVTVTRVLPNGQLEVMGQKRITLNNGNEYVRLTGLVRPEDISPENVVLSDRLANADIRYVGAGTTADTARPGWFARALGIVSPL